MTREEILAISNLIYSDEDAIEKATTMIAEQAENVSLDFSKMDLAQFITETNQPAVRMWCGLHPIYETTLRPHIICGDGTRLSIQASSTHYALPREDWLDKYDSYEVVIMTGCNLKELLQKQKIFINRRSGNMVRPVMMIKQIKVKEAIQWFIDNDPRPEGFDSEASEEEWDMFPEPFGFVPHDILQGFIDACGGIKGIHKAERNRK